MIVSALLVIFLLLLVKSIIVPSGSLGKFERDRRKNDTKSIAVERELYYGEIVSLQHVTESLLLVISAALLVGGFGWLVGTIVAAIVALEYGALARRKMLRSIGMTFYKKLEPKLLTFAEKYASYLRYIRIFTPDSSETVLHSKEELVHLIETSNGILPTHEKKLLLGALEFKQRLVKEVMTPRSVIDAINKTELLGPLVLHDLHETGHSRFPVIENDVDHVVGILHLRDILHVDTSKKHTQKVETAMEAKVFYIHENQSLDHALTAFVATHHHLFIVVNDYRETVGILTLEDTIEQLIGQKIVDEFDAHDDLRSVAGRNPHHNNSTKDSVNV